MSNHTHTQYTIVLHGIPNWEKTTQCFFLYVLKNYIHWKHQLPLFSSCNWKEAPTLLVSQATTWGKHQLPKSLATTRRRLQPPMFSGYNWKVDTTTCPCPILPPWSRSRMMEPLSHYHCEIYRCKHVINLYHKQVHPTMYQLCINNVSTTHQLWLINMYRHHQLYTCMCANSSTTCLNHVLNMYHNQKPSSISSSKYDLYLCNRNGVYHHIPTNLP